MRNLILGFVLGSLFTASIGIAGNSGTWGSKGQPGSNGPTGSIAQYDYFRLRQSWLDLHDLRKQGDEARPNQSGKPCGR